VSPAGRPFGTFFRLRPAFGPWLRHSARRSGGDHEGHRRPRARGSPGAAGGAVPGPARLRGRPVGAGGGPAARRDQAGAGAPVRIGSARKARTRSRIGCCFCFSQPWPLF